MSIMKTKKLRKKVYAAAGYNTIFMGTGRKEFNPKGPLRPFEEYLKEVAEGSCAQIPNPEFDEGVIGSFMSGRFINQANLPGFLPFMIPSLYGKPCTAVEGACGTGGRAIDTAVRSVLSDLADVVFVTGFEMQNTVKAIYGADILAGASFYKKERKNGGAYFFPGIFAARAGAYYEKYGYDQARPGMAQWFVQSIENARKNPKAQEYENANPELFTCGMSAPSPEKFVPYLNYYDCSKVSDGASSVVILSEEGLKRCGIKRADAVEIIGIAGAEGDITEAPVDPTVLTTTEIAGKRALEQAGIRRQDLGLLELHDCFTITALLALESLGFAKKGAAGRFILDGGTAPGGEIPTNLSGGLGGFGHPTGATGVRQLVDLLHQQTGRAANQVKVGVGKRFKAKSPYGMMISMGGNDKTVTAVVTVGCG